MSPRASIRRTSLLQACRRLFRPTGEQLESRLLLAAANIFAQFQGELLASEASDTIRVNLTAGNFSIAGGHATLGIVVQPGAGSRLAANPIGVHSLAAGNVPVIAQAARADGSSLVLAKLKLGEHDLRLTSSGGTHGTWQVQVFLAGDVNGDFTVNNTDKDQLQDLKQGQISDPVLRATADFDRDGQITGFDQSQASQNNGVSTSLRVFSLTAGLDPASETGAARRQSGKPHAGQLHWPDAGGQSLSR